MKRLRRMLHITQEELGYRAGVHPTYISDLERGKKSPSAYTVLKIASALDISPGQLLNECQYSVYSHNKRIADSESNQYNFSNKPMDPFFNHDPKLGK